MTEVTVVIGAGQIVQAIARRVSAGKHVLLADLHQANADAARGDVTGVIIHAAGVSPSQATPEVILRVDLYGTALVLEEFGTIIASGGSAVVIASQSGHRLGALTAEQDAALATTPADELLSLPMLQPGQVTNSLHAYQLATAAPGSTPSAPASSSPRSPETSSPDRAARDSAGCSSYPTPGVPGRRTRSAPSARSSWDPTERSSQEVTSFWTAASPRPTSSASWRRVALTGERTCRDLHQWRMGRDAVARPAHSPLESELAMELVHETAATG